MTIGFHTVEHDPLPDLDDPALEDAVSRGREDLAAAAGAAVRYFAYPHGKADARSAMAVRRAGFDAAFTGAAQPLRHGDDAYRLGRWEPGPLGVDDLLVEARRASPPRRPPSGSASVMTEIAVIVPTHNRPDLLAVHVAVRAGAAGRGPGCRGRRRRVVGSSSRARRGRSARRPARAAASP